ncbi:MAG TPA: diguanylate cyclase [Gemmatimonadales bacterium]|nr:diguanylate cyclase [Gemmatimonadales bacterium]
MTDRMEELLAALRREYVADGPARLAELRKDLAAFLAGEPDAVESLTGRFHRLAGSGGSYGFEEISTISQEVEQWLRADPAVAPNPDARGRLSKAVDRLSAAFDTAALQVDLSQPELPQHGDFGWRARIVGPAGAQQRQVEHLLSQAGYLVTSDTGVGEPARVPLSERPDLLVLLADPDGSDPYATAAAWSAAGAARPRAMVLIAGGGLGDPVRAASAGIDAAIVPERIGAELPRYAKTLARVGAPPSRVLLAIQDQKMATDLTRALEPANLQVATYSSMAAVHEALLREPPDVVITELKPPVDGLALTRMMRQDARFALLPVICLATEDTVGGRIEAIKAGADHLLVHPVEAPLLTHLVVSRAERGRRLREMVHRDGLTGLLNHATLMSELEHTLEYARRHGETFGFIMADVDHFKRVNDQYGHLVGDQVLLHLARLLQQTVRASDLIGRYGGEEFGLVLRRTDRAGAGVLAGKVRNALVTEPALIGEDRQLPIRMSMGIACYPADGLTAAALALQADQALYRAKRGGRDRVEWARDNPARA